MAPLSDAARRALDPFRRRLAHAAVLLDLDGTLAPICPRPEEVALPADTRRAVEAVRARAGLVAFVSGRGLQDLERIVAMEGCAYAGNHGMEIRRPDGAHEVVEPVRPWLDAVARFAAQWSDAILAPTGTWLEDKGVTLSFHYRTAPDEGAARRFLMTQVIPAAERAGLRATAGRKVIEVRPPVEVNKGTAVRQIVAASGCEIAAYAGDDTTDLDAWIALRAMVDERAISAAQAIAVAADETPADVLAAADVVVQGTAGARDALVYLASDQAGSAPGVTPS